MAVLIATQFLPAVAWADGELQLILPLVSAMAFGVSAVDGARKADPARPPRLTVTPPPEHGRSVLPQRLRIPDGYEIDVDRTVPRFAAPVDRDRRFAIDVLNRPRQGFTASFAYDEEDRGPFPDTGQVIRLEAEFRF